MNTVPFFDLQDQTAALEPELLERMQQVLLSGQFTLGPFVGQFERDFAAYCGAAHCVAVNSGTSALHLALASLDVGPGDEVITTPATFVATAWAIRYTGATPVFVDIDPATRTLDPNLLEGAITPRTKAILPVHLYGHPADMDAILAIANEYGLPVIEDAAQAHGARYLGQRVGALGRIGCFSFYPSKNLGALGEGGALTTNDAETAARARALRNHAQTEKNRHDQIGFNYRMAALQGAVLGVKLARLDRWNQLRRQRAAEYLQALNELAEIDGMRLPREQPGCQSVYHLFVVESPRRDELAATLQSSGVQTGIHYPIPVHLQPAFADLGLRPGSFPEAERLARQCLSLPIFPEMTRTQVERVCDGIRQALPVVASR